MSEVTLVVGVIGAEIHGIDLTQPLSKTVGEEIDLLLLEHEVISPRDQDIDAAQVFGGNFWSAGFSSRLPDRRGISGNHDSGKHP